MPAVYCMRLPGYQGQMVRKNSYNSCRVKPTPQARDKAGRPGDFTRILKWKDSFDSPSIVNDLHPNHVTNCLSKKRSYERDLGQLGHRSYPQSITANPSP